MSSYISLLLFAATVLADCECGYTVNSTSSTDFALFTDLFETDFLHLHDVTYNTSYSTGWIPQNYNTSANDGSGPYGMAKQSTNLLPNYLLSPSNYVDGGVKNRDPGLQLYVRSSLLQQPADQPALVPLAEIVSERDDILYGSFRIAMKTSPINGTCAAFYFYCNDSQELDVEISGAEQMSASKHGPVHFVAQNTITEDGLAGSKQFVDELLSPPSDDYNEYRFDWLPGRVDFYVNGKLLSSTTENVPSSPGRIHISHWSNGNPSWSRGPPLSDAVMTVSYVKAYFNSTNLTRSNEYSAACASLKKPTISDQTCEIPAQLTAPNPFGPDGNFTGTFFFSDHPSMTPNQTIYQPKENSATDNMITMSRTQYILIMLVTGQIATWGRPLF